MRSISRTATAFRLVDRATIRAFLGAAILVISPAGAATQESPTQQATSRGNMMYAYDRAAWVTSDDLIARLPRARDGEVGGWIVTALPNALHVDYFGKDAAADRVVYAADVIGESVTRAIVYPAEAEPELKQPALQMARALRAAWIEIGRHDEWQPCAPARFNTIVLPPESDGTVRVYFLTPEIEAGKVPFGGHFEVDIAADGKTAGTRAFTRGCITLGKQPNEKGAPAVVFVTHLLDPQPTEIHVFEQYYIGVPVVVVTGPKSLWKVQSGTIEDVSRLMPN